MKSLYESIFDTDFEPTVDNTKIKPRSKGELQQIIAEHIKQLKPRPGQEVDLNWIDISKVDNLGWLFYKTDYIPVIDAWKIDHVKKFDYMFADNKYIVRSPLPRLQTKLRREYCYDSMFAGCALLEVAPELPATELTDGCYYAMFNGCSLLKESPMLQAKKLAPRCYTYMFSGCRSLEEPPVLPATELTKDCYRSMFENCASLKVAPELPATKLTKGCYAAMFADCTALTHAPELPATKLAEYCYWHMFKNCKSLTQRADMPADYYDYAQDMYDGCPCDR